MKNRITFKKVFCIENILMVIAILIFCGTLFTKIQSQRNFTKLYTYLTSYHFSFHDIVSTYDADTLQKFSSDLYKNLRPYTICDEKLTAQLNTICYLIQHTSDTQEYQKQLSNCIYNFQTAIFKNQQKINTSYDCYIYSAFFIAFISLLVASNKSQQQKNQLLKKDIINSSQLKLSRDLHDGVAQDLYAVRVYIKKQDNEKADYYAEQALKEARYLIDSMHLDMNQRLTEIIKQSLSAFEANYDIKTRLYIVSVSLELLPVEVQLELLKIIQEALSNTARHSNATEVSLKFTDIGNDLKIIISDNGQGFTEEEVAVKYKGSLKKHYGLSNIKERVKNLNGTVEFINNGGTTIAILLKNIIH